MVSLWVMRINLGWSTLEDVPDRYLEQVKERLGIAE